MSERVVDEDGPERDEDEKRHKVHLLGPGASHNERRHQREHHLEGDVDLARNCRRERKARIRRDVEQHAKVQRPQHAILTRSKRQRESKHDPDQGANHHRRQSLHNHRERILAANRTGLREARKRRLQKHKGRRHNHKRGVARINAVAKEQIGSLRIDEGAVRRDNRCVAHMSSVAILAFQIVCLQLSERDVEPEESEIEARANARFL
jgi:hypothetical protein